MEEDSKKRFSNRAENYKKYRPHYPKEITNFLIDKQILKKDSVIADIGSGTGLLSELFLEDRYLVYCVEPNDNMRKAAEENFKKLSNFCSRNGSAESTGLSNNQVDIITAAQAFHWFDIVACHDEFFRILKDNGYVILIWNVRKNDTNDFMKSYEDLLNKYRRNSKKIQDKQDDKTRAEKFFSNEEFQTKVFKNNQFLDFEGLKGYMLSISYIPTEEDPIFNTMIAELKDLFDEYQVNGQIEILYDTQVYYGQLQKGNGANGIGDRI